MFNRIGKFIEHRGISRYRFWQDTKLGRDTAYRLCNDPTYIPTGAVLDKICSTYRLQPGEFLEWHSDEPARDPGNPPGPNDAPIEVVREVESREKDLSIESLTCLLGGLNVIEKKVS